MHFFTLLIVVYGAVFSVLHLALFFGVIIERSRERRFEKQRQPEAARPLVSVVVPVRNEEALLPALLAGLKAQSWSNIEFLFVDDGSTDSTLALLEGFKRQSVPPVHIIVMAEEGAAVNRKQRALCRGIAAARGDVLLFTDADCEVGPDWADYMTRYAVDRGTGVVLGPVYKKAAAPRAGGFLDAFQCFDHMVRGMYIAAAVGLGAASGAFGNNLAVRKQALVEAGGYESIPVSITEDAAMIALIRKNTRFRVRAVYNEAAHVYTRSESSWKALINQTLRWHHGGLFASDPVTALSFGSIALLFFLCALCFPFALVYPPFLIIPLIVFLEIVLGNLPVKIYAGKSVPLTLPGYLFFSFFMGYFFTLLTVLSFIGKRPEWKR